MKPEGLTENYSLFICSLKIITTQMPAQTSLLVSILLFKFVNKALITKCIFSGLIFKFRPNLWGEFDIEHIEHIEHIVHIEHIEYQA